MLVTSIFSFSHNVFKRLIFQGHQKSGLFGKELSLIDNLCFFCVKYFEPSPEVQVMAYRTGLPANISLSDSQRCFKFESSKTFNWPYLKDPGVGMAGLIPQISQFLYEDNDRQYDRNHTSDHCFDDSYMGK